MSKILRKWLGVYRIGCKSVRVCCLFEGTCLYPTVAAINTLAAMPINEKEDFLFPLVPDFACLYLATQTLWKFGYRDLIIGITIRQL